ncbi:MAG: DHA2 family efflux MFS transporter permease subunit [Actinomycetota bacterium]|nr:DHA2 family efflux MFS transporter permease subunit [Actinomycetota bacterium]
MTDGTIAYGSATGRWVLGATVLGSGIAFLDGTVVNVALPAIDRELDAGISGLQWIVDSYLLTLSAFLLLGGSLGDLCGRRRMFTYGLGGFAGASLFCAVAPTTELLVAARALQGVAAALLVPGSLAIISTSFAPGDAGKAIGAWSGLSGVTTALGPFLGGYLVDSVSWRWIFVINLPLAAAAIWMASRHVPETMTGGARPDAGGAITAAVALGGVTYGLIEGPGRGWNATSVVTAIAAGLMALALFVRTELTHRDPMLPFGIFRSRQFSGANATTLLVYFALGGSFFFLVIELQRELGYSALEAGAALIPITLLLLLLSPRAGALASRIGPRVPMTAGPLVAALGLALMTNVGPGAAYATRVLPPVVVFGLGLSLTVAPLTTAVLAAVPSEHAGIGSGVNNAVARVAGLLAVALLPLVAGVGGVEEVGATDFTEGFRRATWASAALCALGGVVSWLTIRGGGAGSPVAAPAPEHPPEATAA